MNQEQILSLLRTILKSVGTVLITRGVTDSAGLEAIIGGIVVAAGLLWSWWNAREKNTLKDAVAGDVSLSDPKVKAIVAAPAPTHDPVPV